MNTHDELRGALQRRADGVGWDAGDHPLDLADVQGRARGIRRRRVAVSGLAAAAVLAVAVPVGLNATGPGGARSVDPAGPTPSRAVRRSWTRWSRASRSRSCSPPTARWAPSRR